MDIKIRKIDLEDIDVFEFLAKWSNDAEIRPYATPRFSEEGYKDILMVEIIASLMENPSKSVYLVCDGEKPIGELSIDMNFSHRVYKEDMTAWISLLIGEAEYRGRGISKIMMDFIEAECRRLGARAIELGVFEYNHRAQSLYLASGYHKIDEIKAFVFNFGSWHSDIRMLKKLF